MNDEESMILVTFDHHRQLEFLMQVLDAYVRKGGIGAEDLPLAADTYMHLRAAQVMPIKPNLGKATSAEVGRDGLALEFAAPAAEEPDTLEP